MPSMNVIRDTARPNLLPEITAGLANLAKKKQIEGDRKQQQIDAAQPLLDKIYQQASGKTGEEASRLFKAGAALESQLTGVPLGQVLGSDRLRIAAGKKLVGKDVTNGVIDNQSRNQKLLGRLAAEASESGRKEVGGNFFKKALQGVGDMVTDPFNNKKNARRQAGIMRARGEAVSLLPKEATQLELDDNRTRGRLLVEAMEAWNFAVSDPELGVDSPEAKEAEKAFRALGGNKFLNNSAGGANQPTKADPQSSGPSSVEDFSEATSGAFDGAGAGNSLEKAKSKVQSLRQLGVKTSDLIEKVEITGLSDEEIEDLIDEVKKGR